MCPPKLLWQVRTIIDEKAAQGERFTAYDVTCQLRSDNNRVKHDEVRGEVHRIYLDGGMPGYSRYLANKGGPVPAWEYSPAGATCRIMAGLSLRRLLPHPLSSHRAPSGARTYGATPNRAPLPASGGSTAVPLDRRATVCIPARLVRQVALHPGDKVHVFIDAQNLQLLVRRDHTVHDPNRLPARRYTVDKHHNIRITRTPQVRAGLLGPHRRILARVGELVVMAA